MDVAVVVTAFDQGGQVAEAVASVRAQTRPVTELVVVDDGSAGPGSLAALDALRTDGVHVLRQANRGVAAARNTGITATGAPLVVVLDGDDRLAPAFLERVLPRLDDPEVVAASAWLRLHGVASGTARPAFQRHLVDVLVAQEETAVRRLAAWEDLVATDPALPLGDPSYGDGGMAAHVRVATVRAARPV